MRVPDSCLDPRAIDTLCDLASASPPGNFAEVGVWRGGSAWHLNRIAKEQGRRVYLYDTFRGIPFKSAVDSHEIGDFSDVDISDVVRAMPDAFVVPGVFPLSLIDMGPLAFVHVDCNQYESVKACCTTFPPLLVEDGMMLFDDYASLVGATRAVDESLDRVSLTREGKALWIKGQVA